MLILLISCDQVVVVVVFSKTEQKRKTLLFKKFEKATKHPRLGRRGVFVVCF